MIPSAAPDAIRSAIVGKAGLAKRVPNDPAGYRADIDGLRAVAVLAVVFFHAGIDWFSGGYVGVDVFFVISGFLITRIIAGGVESGAFSFANFYRRRIRRLFPAYFVLLVAVLLTGLWLSLPKELVDLGQSLVASAGFATNVLFWRESGYFAGASEIKPLLHTWSLSVEEQFYLIFPAFLVLVAKFTPRMRAVWIWLILLCSLALSELFLSSHGSAVFYLLPTRSWELLLGSVLALAPAAAAPTRGQAQFAGVAGLLLIAAAVALMTAQTPFPGLSALVPCLGAAALIWAGSTPNIGSTLISGSLMTFVGKISYSLYLWHWPIFAYYRYYNVDELSTQQSLAAIGLSFVIAILSWRFVEQPFRCQSKTPSFKPYRAVLVSSLTLMLVGFALIRGDGLKGRFDERVTAMLAQSAPVRDSGCMAGPSAWKELDATCVYPDNTSNASVALIGDSHAHALLPAVTEAAAEVGQAVRFYGYTACPPVPFVKRVAGGSANRCDDWNSAVLADLVSREEVKTVFVAARHAVYLKGFTGEYGPSEGEGRIAIELMEDSQFGSAATIQDGYFQRMNMLVAKLRRAGKKVVIVMPVPEVGYDVPATLALMLRKGQEPRTFTRPYSIFLARQADINDEIARIAAEHGADTVVPQDALCDGTVCHVIGDGLPFYYDDDHLSVTGGRLLVPDMVQALQTTQPH